MPAPIFFAAFLTWISLLTNRVNLSFFVAALLLVAINITPWGLVGRADTLISASAIKMPSDARKTVDYLRNNLQSQSQLLAPDNIALWVPTMEGHPRSVYIRHDYLDQLALAVGEERIKSRRTLAEWMNDENSVSSASVELALREHCVDYILLPKTKAKTDIIEKIPRFSVLTKADYEGYSLYEIENDCQ